MRAFLTFFLMLFLAMALAAVVAYPAWSLVGLVAVFPIHRVMSRFAMLFGLFGMIYLTRRMGLADRKTLGYGLPRKQFIMEMSLAFAIGLALMVPLIASLMGLHIRTLAPDVNTVQAFLAAAGKGMLTGFAVAFIEETFFRGALFAAVSRESGTLSAVLLTSFLYAILHFLSGDLRIPADQASWNSGFLVFANLFNKYADPLGLFDSMLALFAVGLLLAMVRVRTGAIAACIGLHAGWVSVITVLRTATVRNPTSAHAWLVGSYDGVIGWLAVGWIGLFAALYYWQWRRAPAS